MEETSFPIVSDFRQPCPVPGHRNLDNAAGGVVVPNDIEGRQQRRSVFRSRRRIYVRSRCIKTGYGRIHCHFILEFNAPTKMDTKLERAPGLSNIRQFWDQELLIILVSRHCG
jgi:hypothetical protein